MADSLNPEGYNEAVTRLGRVGAWAPGGYVGKCLACDRQFFGDKRATSCLPCAVTRLADALSKYERLAALVEATPSEGGFIDLSDLEKERRWRGETDASDFRPMLSPSPPINTTPIADALSAQGSGVDGRHHHGRHPWAQPGDQPKRQFILRFDDHDMREQVFEEEAEAWAAYWQFCPAWNVTLYAAMPVAPQPSADRERVERLAKRCDAAVAVLNGIADAYEYHDPNYAHHKRAEAAEAIANAQALRALAGLTNEAGEWRPIETAPKDRLIEVFAPGAQYDLNDLISLCQWHEDAGFCVCELREPTHWREHLPPAPSPLVGKEPSA